MSTLDPLDAFHRLLRACRDLQAVNTACSISSADAATYSGRRRYHAKARGGILGNTILLAEGTTADECVSSLARQAKAARQDYEAERQRVNLAHLQAA